MSVCIHLGFGGTSFFQAIVQQQRKAHGTLLPVQQELHVSFNESQEQTAPQHVPGSSLSDGSGLQSFAAIGHQIAAQEGYARQPLTTARPEVPRSKAERALTKRAWSFLCREVQPSAIPLTCSSNSTGPLAASSADPSTQPALRHLTVGFVASFAASTSLKEGPSSLPPAPQPQSNGLRQCPPCNSAAGSQLHQLLLEEPVIAATAWDAQARLQGPTVLLCEPAELRKLVLVTHDDTTPSAWEPARVKVVSLPMDAAASLPAATQTSAPIAAAHSTGPSTEPRHISEPASTHVPSVQQVVQSWVLHQRPPWCGLKPVQPRHPQGLGSPAAAAATAAPEGGETAAAGTAGRQDTSASAGDTGNELVAASPTAHTAPPDHHTMEQPVDAAAVVVADCTSISTQPAVQVPSTNTHCRQTPAPTAANAGCAVTAAQPTGVSCRELQLKLPAMLLDEPALPCAWLCQQPAAVAHGRHVADACCPLSFFSLIHATAAAEQAKYHSSSSADAADPGHDSSPLAELQRSATAAGFVCCQLPPTAASAAAGAPPRHPQQQQLCSLLLPGSTVPTAMLLARPGFSSAVMDKGTASQPQPSAASKLRHGGANLSQVLVKHLTAINRPNKHRQPSARIVEPLCIKKRASVVSTICRDTPSPSNAGCQQVPGHAAAGANAPGPVCGGGSRLPAATAAAHDTDAAAGPAVDPQQQQQQQMVAATDTTHASQPSSASGPAGCCSPIQLSPHSLLIEVPVCLPQQPSQPLDVQLLQAALSEAQAALQHAGFPPSDKAATAAGCQGSSERSTVAWDSSWGNLRLQHGSRDRGSCPAAASTAEWCLPAVLRMLTGAALQDCCSAGVAGHQHGSQAAAAGPTPGNAAGSNQQHALLGQELLEQMLAADMQLGADSELLLPVVMFPDTDSCCDQLDSGVGSNHLRISPELLLRCGYRQQSTAHLELFFDWSMLQPQLQVDSQLLPVVSGATKRRSCSSSTGPNCATGKRIRLLQGGAAAGVQQGLSDRGLGQDAAALFDNVLKHPGLQQLCKDLQQQQLTKQQGFGSGLCAAAELVSKSGRPAAASVEAAGAVKSRLWFSREVFSAWLLQPLQTAAAAARELASASSQQPCPQVGAAAEAAVAYSCCAARADGPAGLSSRAAAGIEEVPAVVAEAAAAWQSAQRLQQPVMAATSTGVGASVLERADPPGATSSHPASDHDWFMQLNTGLQQGKRRRSFIAELPSDQSRPSAECAQQPASGPDPAAAAVQQVSLSPAAAAKRRRSSAVQQRPQQPCSPELQVYCHAPEQQQQQQKQVAQATADLALNGAVTVSAAGQLADAAASRSCVPAGPTVVTIQVSGSIQQLLHKLNNMRQSVLSSMHCPGPELVEAALWDDVVAQRMLLRLKAQQQQQQQQQQGAGSGVSAQQRQHNKSLVVLVLLSQTAGCLLHYGIRVAHMFLQHGVQRLPSVSDACRPALLALSAANEVCDQMPHPPRWQPHQAAAGKGCSWSRQQQQGLAAEEHPKLQRLLELVEQLRSSDKSCKLLIIAESKAFFSLYHALSAAGVVAAQLDRDRQLQALEARQAAATGKAGATQHPAEGGSSAYEGGVEGQAAANSALVDAQPLLQEAWAAAVQRVLTVASCVLATHEQLHHPCMPLQGFSSVIEYVAWEDTAAGAAAAAAANDGPCSPCRPAFAGGGTHSKHFVFQVNKPDMSAAAAQAAREAVQTIDRPLPTADSRQPASATQAATGTDGITAAATAAVHTPATAEVLAEPPAGAAGAVEVPLVLNVGPGSLVKQRQPLYQSLLQLEMQGYVLVMRNLQCGSNRGPAVAAACAAVDVVLSPKACLCIWTDSRLPQDPAGALQCLSRAVLALSMAYDAAWFLLELPDALLQDILRSSGNLQALGRAAGITVQLITCFTAANTQDAVLHICTETARGFWAAAAAAESSRPTGSSMQPPQALLDVPSAAEEELSTSVALNPLSAALLASQGATLRSLFELVTSDSAAAVDQQAVLRSCLPAKSLQLLQVQAAAVAERIQQRRLQEQQELLQPSPQQPAHAPQQHMQPGQWQQQQHEHGQWQSSVHADQLEQQQQPCWGAGMAEGVQQGMPGVARDAGGYYSDAHEVPGGTSFYPALNAWQQAEALPVHHPAPPLGQGPALHPDPAPWQPWHEEQQGQQPPHWPRQQPAFLGVGSAGPHTMLPHDGPPQQEQQQQHWMHPDDTPPQIWHAARDTAEGSSCDVMDMDPSAVLDQFLNRRSAAPPGPSNASLPGQHHRTAQRPGSLERSTYQQPHSMHQSAWADAVLGPAPGWQQQQQHWQQGHPHVMSTKGHRGAATAAAAAGYGIAGPSAAFDTWADASEYSGCSPLGPGVQGAGGWALQNAEQSVWPDMEGWEGAAEQDQLQHMEEPIGDAGGYGRGPHRHGLRPHPQGAAHMSAAAHAHAGVLDSAGGSTPGQPSRAVHRRQQQAYLQHAEGYGAQLGDPPETQQSMPTEGRGGRFAAAMCSMREGQSNGYEETAFLAPASVARSAVRPNDHSRPPSSSRGAQGPDGVPGNRPALRGSREPAAAGKRAGAASRPASSNTGSYLTVPAFMPHHNPNKQLKYKRPAAATGVAKAARKGKGGCQTKLCWG